MMRDNMNRRQFLRIGAATPLGVELIGVGASPSWAAGEKPVRLGMVGVGGRGTSLLSLLLSMDGVEVPAICDINGEHLSRAQAMVEKAGRNQHPEGSSQKGLPHFVGRAKRQPSSWAFFEIWIHEGDRGPRKKGRDRTHRCSKDRTVNHAHARHDRMLGDFTSSFPPGLEPSGNCYKMKFLV